MNERIEEDGIFNVKESFEVHRLDVLYLFCLSKTPEKISLGVKKWNFLEWDSVDFNKTFFIFNT